MKRALVLISSYFPQGVAISSRILNFCRLLTQAGYSVHVIAGHTNDQPIEVGRIYNLEGFTFQVALTQNATSFESYFGNPQFVEACKKYIESHEVDVAFITVGSCIYKTIKKMLTSHGIRVFVEQCEWMDTSSYRFGRFDIRYIQVANLRKNGYDHPDGIVSISRLLNDYYTSIGVKSIRIPTILDVRNMPARVDKRQEDKIRLVFAGSLGGTKELMLPIIQAFADSERLRNDIQLDIYGPSRKQIVANIDGKEALLEKAGPGIVIHGRIPQDNLPEVYMESDYSIFIRPERRSSNAGFPTKLAESMAVGTPVITNHTGDISLYLQDRKNGYLLDDNSPKAVCACLQTIISISSGEYVRMRREARNTAELAFDFRAYTDTVKSFMNA